MAALLLCRDRCVVNSAAPVDFRVGIHYLRVGSRIGNADMVAMADNRRKVADADDVAPRAIAPYPGQDTIISVVPVDPLESAAVKIDFIKDYWSTTVVA